MTSISPTTGFTGGHTLVTITGTGMVSGATVKFDTADCTPVTVATNGQSLTCTTSAHSAGIPTITVTNPNATSATLPTPFVYKVDGFSAVDTVIGRISLGSADGPGSQAQFAYPQDLTSDGTNLFITDTLNHTIRKIVIASGVTTTFAGSPGVTGSTDATGTAARFKSPLGITNDGTFLYVCDSGNHTIRKIEIATGIVTTLAGTAGTSGTTDATGAAARFNSPKFLDNDGTYLYVSDTGNHTIRRVDSAGVVTTIAGVAGAASFADGAYLTSRLSSPKGIHYLASSHSLYFADSNNNTIRALDTTTNTVSTLAGDSATQTTGSTNNASGLSALFNHPAGITTDGTFLYVADGDNCQIRKVAIAGPNAVTSIAGSTTVCGLKYSSDGTGSSAFFANPSGIVVVGSFLYLAGNNDNAIRKIDPASGVVTTLAGTLLNINSNGVGTAVGLDALTGIASDGVSSLYLSSFYGNQVRKLNLTSNTVTALVGNPLNSGSADGTTTSATFNGVGASTFLSGKVYSIDSSNQTIRVIDTTASPVSVTTLTGQVGVSGSADGGIGVASFNFGTDSGITNDGTDLYVADHSNHTIRKVSVTGIVTTLAGTSGITGSTDNATGTSALLNSPSDLTVAGGFLYFTDTGNCLIRRMDLTAPNAVTTIAGTAGSCGYNDDVGASATFTSPRGITSDGINLYITDFPVIRKLAISSNLVSTLYGSSTRGYAEATGSLASALPGFANRILFHSSYGLFVSTPDSIQWVH